MQLQSITQSSALHRAGIDPPSSTFQTSGTLQPRTSDDRHAWDSTNPTGSFSPARNAVDSLPPVTRKDQIIALTVGFATIFQTIGPNLSYGVFQQAYASSDSILVSSEASSRAVIALVGTLGAGLTWGGSIAVQPLVNYVGSYKAIALTGGLVMPLAFLLASFCTSLWQLLLTQGLLYGVGSSMVYFPLISVVPPYFSSRRGAATGVILSAAGIGGLAFSLAIQSLLECVGIRWTLRAIALENLIVNVPMALYARDSRTLSSATGSLLSSKVITKPAFIFQALAALLQAAGNFVPMTFTPEFSTVLGYSVGFGAVLLAINNGVNSVSRVLMGILADRWGRQNTLLVSMVGSAAAVFGLWLVAAVKVNEEARRAWIVFVVFYGILAGGFNSLFPAIIPDIFPLSMYASVNSFLYFARGVGAAFGSPVGGQILGNSRSGSTMGDVSQALLDYRNLIWYDGALLTAAALCVAGVRIADAVDRKHWQWRA